MELIVHRRIHERRSCNLSICQFKPGHIFIPYFSKVHFNIISPFVLYAFKYISHHTVYGLISCIFCRSYLIYCSNSEWKVKLFKPLVNLFQYVVTMSRLVPYLFQHFIPKNPLSISLNRVRIHVSHPYKQVQLYLCIYFCMGPMKVEVYFSYLRTELSPSWDAANCAANQKIPSNFKEPDGSSLCSQEPSTSPYLEPVRSSPYHPILPL
jgi:hypothetical protein